MSDVVGKKGAISTDHRTPLLVSSPAIPLPPKLQSSSTNMSPTTTNAAQVTTPIAHVKTRFLVLSDTHASSLSQSSHNDAPYRQPLPSADVLLHCGDLTMVGHLDEYEKTMAMLESVDAELKLVIAGNHDISLDEVYYERMGRRMQGRWWDEALPRKAREMWTGQRAKEAGVTYLEEGSYTFLLKNGARLRVSTNVHPTGEQELNCKRSMLARTNLSFATGQ